MIAVYELIHKDGDVSYLDHQQAVTLLGKDGLEQALCGTHPEYTAFYEEVQDYAEH